MTVIVGEAAVGCIISEFVWGLEVGAADGGVVTSGG